MPLKVFGWQSLDSPSDPPSSPPLAGGSAFCAVIATVHLSKAPNTYGGTQIDYELVTFNLVKGLKPIDNFKVRAERGGNERTGGQRKMRTYKENPGFENPGITLGSPYRIRTGDLRLERAAS